MRYAIGTPGEPVRQYLTVPPYMIAAQLRDGEVAVETDVRGVATIGADGASVVAENLLSSS